jgi:hypothetical protein
VRSAILGAQQREVSIHRIAQDVAVFLIGKRQAIPESARILIRRQRRPVRTTIAGLIEPALLARSGGHHDRYLRIPRPDAPEIQLLRTLRHAAPLPHIAGILGPQHRSPCSTRPRHPVSGGMNAPQRLMGAAMLGLPRIPYRTRRALRLGNELS